MGNIQTVIKAELDPSLPVPELLSVIQAVTRFHPTQERSILLGLMENLEKRLIFLDKGAEKHAKSPDEPGRDQADKGELG
ncbi:MULTISPECIES: hypothetical protein [unclassified Paenibacillus]|uniref:hypothetical protein n=1 Tax=unclassified Paenibacillus TaxID=185978 RepID=UPI0024071702|nr:MULTISPECIES: hypothetical protein [unclassified Paenibacillus]MDF9845167.1 hypothetical protein [Paenibacillus sp. PastF-2]MDF9850341.1 hypothetical protein [Paenibacillus sp. PastM-2]MDF9856956.1 hypothetical protein [Paenibacillus sp. PastF-1]MDH6482187.1 hypothetical protein [Paenibacillus sp. PastH-2]MDH6509649.1 hypothetical protein [Paenibacillus sp. PastM-3]